MIGAEIPICLCGLGGYVPRVSNLKEKAVYGIVTPAIVEEITGRRLLAADLLSHASDRETSHAAAMVRETVSSIRDELLSLIS